MRKQIRKLGKMRAGGQIVKQSVCLKISLMAEDFSLWNGGFGGFFSA
ncbi:MULTISPECIES: hypothetical protein [Rahnella]|jgi:hypothetical protein|nr:MULTISPECIES: hypothetical protein [Rahnella]MBU9862164.1 hypothetical protein [Rahnella aceris]MBU9867718.1 hypothetical protein [Rahnella aceris]MCM2443755.1 hypothetical protein [Rahnella sp. CG8]NIA86856.1 hypothetical protein [Rahnella aceris]QQN35074.1 hypothetical protein JHW33_22335 [Rahnella aceris]